MLPIVESTCTDREDFGKAKKGQGVVMGEAVQCLDVLIQKRLLCGGGQFCWGIGWRLRFDLE